MADKYIRVDSGTHFIRSLQLADQNLKAQQKDEAVCSWIAGALHDALYSLLIEKISGTDGFGIFSDKFEKKVREWYSENKPSSDPSYVCLQEESLDQNIASLGVLLKRASLASGAEIRDRNIEELNRPSLGLSRLKAFRNYLAHPRPMLASYQESYLIEAFQDTLDVITEVSKLAGKTYPQHDPEEARILLLSISFYLNKWSDSLSFD